MFGVAYALGLIAIGLVAVSVSAALVFVALMVAFTAFAWCTK